MLQSYLFISVLEYVASIQSHNSDCTVNKLIKRLNWNEKSKGVIKLTKLILSIDEVVSRCLIEYRE